MTKINFEAVQDQKTDFEPIPEDRYTLECVEAVLGISKNGNKKIDAQFKIIDDDEFNNRRVFTSFSLLPNALFNLKNYFEAAGLDTSGEFEEKDISDMLIGTKTTAFVEAETYIKPETKEKHVNFKPKNWKSTASGDENSLFS